MRERDSKLLCVCKDNEVSFGRWATEPAGPGQPVCVRTRGWRSGGLHFLPRVIRNTMRNCGSEQQIRLVDINGGDGSGILPNTIRTYYIEITCLKPYVEQGFSVVNEAEKFSAAAILSIWETMGAWV